jgi:DNA-binding HxlR family transcriptional regulator
MSQFRFVLVVFYFTAVLIFAVYLRGANNHVFYKLSQYNARQNQLKQRLVAKQLQLESLINPSALSKRLKQLETDE